MLIRISVSNLGLVWINIFHHSISVTHHSSFKIPYPFGTITHLLLLNIFHTVCGPHTCHLVLFFFFFFPIPKLTVNLSLKKKKIVAQPQSPVIIQGTFTNARARKMTSLPRRITQTTQKIPKTKKIHRNPINLENRSNP